MSVLGFRKNTWSRATVEPLSFNLTLLGIWFGQRHQTVWGLWTFDAAVGLVWWRSLFDWLAFLMMHVAWYGKLYHFYLKYMSRFRLNCIEGHLIIFEWIYHAIFKMDLDGLMFYCFRSPLTVLFEICCYVAWNSIVWGSGTSYFIRINIMLYFLYVYMFYKYC